MMCTEKEAMERWCPLSRVHVPGDPATAHNRVALMRGDEWEHARKAPASYCVASACMAWRFLDERPGDSRGYCGAFGKP